jgi:type I restriction enzyme S subunit
VTEWHEVALGDLGSRSGRPFATGPFGSSIGTKYFTDRGVPLIRGSNLSTAVGKRLVHDGLTFVSEDKAAQHARSIAVPGDLVFTCWGTIGQVGFIDAGGPFERYLISNKQMKMTPDPRRVDGLFLYYLMSSPQMLADVRSRSIGAAVPGFNLGQLRETQVLLPDSSTQRSISSVLAAFDDLIEINEQRMALLEGLARSIHREWFVHFRFPKHEDVNVQDADPGLTPHGWRVRRLDEIATIVMGQSPRSEFYNEVGEGLPFHQGVADYGPVLPTHRKFCSQASRTAEPMDILCSVRAPVGRLNVADRKLAIGRGLSAVRRCDGLQALLFEQLRASLGAEDSLGGGTIFKAIGKDELARLPVLEPNETMALAFERAVGPMLSQRIELTIQNRGLSATRDLLLSRLVTGRLDISSMNVGDLLTTEAA